ncbi:MAG: universal stress protein [Chloroflexi bacterium]|nr:universal stress protein [Chloroflexota bacterium]
MFRSLIVPLDGSALAERALPYGIRLAQSGKGKLILMRAVLAPAPRTLDGAGMERDQAEAIAEAEQYLADMAESISGQVAEVQTVAPYGRAAAKILETASHLQADAIVMATHGRTGLSHLLYGSVTEAVLAESALPVCVVYARPGEAPAPPFSPYSARVLVPQDFSGYDAPAVHAALEIVGTRGELVLMTAVTPPDRVAYDEMGHVLAYLDQQEEADKLQARDYLETIAAALRERAEPIQVKIDVRVGDPATGISMAALDEGADLIVMATHGRTGLRRAVLGSVAGKVLRSATTPVMLVHPHPVPTAPTTPDHEGQFGRRSRVTSFLGQSDEERAARSSGALHR